MKKLKEEFLKFIKSYGVIAVAIGIVMGQAIAKVITVIVEGLVMPVLEVVLPGNKWQDAVLHLGSINIKLGLIIAALIDFFTVSLVVFFLVRYILKVESPDK
ncbi:MAG: MscL family protein [Candidatus Omnitrophica bacterium]|nr:MscL family protein [Candidatus Omnitrophota bacterium]MDD5238042.1 MscL family protein [Candidatus Omnitrophota bacterium]